MHKDFPVAHIPQNHTLIVKAFTNIGLKKTIYKLNVSDGETSDDCMLSTDLNDMIGKRELANGKTIIINECFRSVAKRTEQHIQIDHRFEQEKPVLIITDLEVVNENAEPPNKSVRSSKAGKRCNPYVKFIVDYPSGRKNYTVKVDVRYIGWVIVDKKIRFDEAPEDTKIQIQMWNHKEGKRKDEQLFQRDTNFGYLAYKVMLDRSKKIISNYKLFFMSIWRDRFSYENTSFAVDKYGDQ